MSNRLPGTIFWMTGSTKVNMTTTVADDRMLYTTVYIVI